MAPLSPPEYLNKVIAIIEQKALKSPKIDWKMVRAKAFNMISDAKSTADTYAAINYVLSELKDNHSFLQDRSGQGTRLFKTHPNPKIQRRVASSNVLKVGEKKYGFVVVSSLGGASQSDDAKNYARNLQQKILEASKQKLLGWIIDLRGNTGGNMWPMLVGAGPLLGAGTLGFFEYPNINVAWFYESGAAGVVNNAGKFVNFKLNGSLADLPNVPLVVLMDGATASSGEALAISFKGRAKTSFIGEHTNGLSTNNEAIKLPDGATLMLTTSGEADRNCVSYNSGICPDEKVEQGVVPLGAKDDPSIRAAIGWLDSHDKGI